MTIPQILGIAGLLVLGLLAAGTLLGLIDWTDPKGLK